MYQPMEYNLQDVEGPALGLGEAERRGGVAVCSSLKHAAP